MISGKCPICFVTTFGDNIGRACNRCLDESIKFLFSRKWEYKTVDIPNKSDFTDWQFNYFSDEGWEYVDHFTCDHTKVTLLFKRKKND